MAETNAPNQDPRELAHFARHADDWWNESGSYQALRKLTPLRLRWICQHTTLSAKRLLDVGSGGGVLAEALCQQGAQVTAIDAEYRSIAVAKAHAAKRSLPIDYHHTRIEELRLQPFDLITCLEMLEHVPDPATVIKHCARLLKPDGKLFVSTLNRNWMSWIQNVLLGEYALKMIAVGTHQYSKMIRPSELCGWCRKHRLYPAQIRCLRYNPVLDRFWLDEGSQGNYWIVFE